MAFWTVPTVGGREIGCEPMSNLVGLVWEWIFSHPQLRRVMFFVLVGLTLYLGGPVWKLLVFWVFIFGLMEVLEAIGWK